MRVQFNYCNVMGAVYWMPCNNSNIMMQYYEGYAINSMLWIQSNNEYNALMNTIMNVML